MQINEITLNNFFNWLNNSQYKEQQKQIIKDIQRDNPTHENLLILYKFWINYKPLDKIAITLMSNLNRYSFKEALKVTLIKTLSNTRIKTKTNPKKHIRKGYNSKLKKQAIK